ncbi:hypothetical protein [Leptospira sp. GIMC2001]|uniref:hypothetical protein n=1 Tax=Leptospira sp. GIMC2001 TaxID=1513297 RepID=UPI00234B20D0|nr:hypothetical protein [Leptospira sp. GIMC2001]WCL51155.1 hypothetical protein O4O04_10175 [Leptospira sp. GIMC2001]
MKKILIIFLTISFLILINCGKSKSMEIIPEPVVDQVSIISDEICLDSILWVFPANPCISVKGEKDNTTLKTRYYLVYNLSSFDVEFPVGISMQLGTSYNNLLKVSTEYGATLQLISEIPESLISTILNSDKILLSYTNRKETRNIELSAGDRSDLKDYLTKISSQLKSEPKLKIVK